MRIDLARRRPGTGTELIARTERLELIAATPDLIEAELEGPAALGTTLGITVPASWPPGEYDRNALESFRARLKSAGPTAVGWYNWYVLSLDSAGHREALIAGAGYMGPPAQDGSVEIGYCVLPEARRQGFATQIVEFLAARALRVKAVTCVRAHVLESNLTSAGVLRRCGFTPAGPSAQPGLLRYERRRAPV